MMRVHIYLIFNILLLLLTALRVTGEGTKEISPKPDQAALTLDRDYSNFGLYNASEAEQLKIRIGALGEKIYLGLNNKRDTGRYKFQFAEGVEFRLRAPSGQIVYSADMPKPGDEGNIPTWEQAVAGPLELGNAGGYDALEFTASEVGDYILEFDTGSVNDKDYIGFDSQQRLNIDYFDITVANASGQALLGRVHSQAWQITTYSFNGSFTGKVYPYDGESAVYEVDLNGVKPYVFIINFNSKGAVDGTITDPLEARKSKFGNYTTPEFKVFLNPPDENLYQVIPKEIKIDGRANKVTCTETQFCFTSNNKGVLEGYLDFNNNNIYDESTGEIYFVKELEAGKESCISWDGKDKDGNPVTNAEFKILSKVGFGITHLPLYDVENNEFGYKVKVVRPSGVADPELYWDDSGITEGEARDGLVNLEGCKSASDGCHRWVNRGDYQFFDQSKQETINTWWYSQVVLDTIIYNKDELGSVSLSYYDDKIDNRDTVVCKGDSLRFFIYQDGTHFDPVKFKYIWSVNGVPIAPDQAFQGFQLNENSIITIEAVDREGKACTSYDTLKVKVTDKILLESTVGSNCNINSGFINATVITAGTGYQYKWQEFPSIQTGSLINLAPGTYHLKVIHPDFPNCSADTSFKVPGQSEALLDTVIVEAFDCSTIKNAVATVKMKSPGGYLYSWDNQPFTVNASVTPLEPGVHQVIVRDTVSKCEVKKNFQIPVVKFPFSLTKSDETCLNKNGSVTLQFPSGIPVNVQWNGNPLTIKNIENLSAGTFSLSLTSLKSSACTIDTSVVIEQKGGKVKADFNADINLMTDSLAVQDSIRFTNLSVGATKARWTFGDGSLSTVYHPSHKYKEAGAYTITLTAEDIYGCRDEISKRVAVYLGPPCGLALPDAFSPNNDEINEKIGTLGYAVKLDLKIFNRWGEVIFRSEDPKSRWNGSYRGEEVPIGVYPYILEFYCPGVGDKLVKTTKVGDITLVR